MIIRPFEPADTERLQRLRAQAFNIATQTERDVAAREMGPDNYRVAEQDGRILGCVRIYRIGHFFGGRALPAGGVASVAVAAEARGRGVAGALMREVVEELHRDGVPISTLYPATVPVYRRAGYGYGGVRVRWRARLDRLPDQPGDDAEPFDDQVLDELSAVYGRIAAATNGLLDRSRWFWEHRVLTTPWHPEPAWCYLVRDGDEVTGWVIYRLESGGHDHGFTLSCRDLHWTTPTAARGLFRLAALHRSTGHAIEWIGPPADPLADLPAEDVLEHASTFRWMLRLVNVPAALEARGYSPHVEAETTVEVRDPIISANAGPWRVAVSRGSATVERARTPAASIADVATWSSIFSGHRAPADAVRTGALRASEDALRALTAIFAGPAPWMSDYF